MLNIGFVLYTKGDAQGTLNARWSFSNTRHGTGIATGGPAEGFGGHYDVRYFDDNGKFVDEWKLVVEKTGELASSTTFPGALMARFEYAALE